MGEPVQETGWQEAGSSAEKDTMVSCARRDMRSREHRCGVGLKAIEDLGSSKYAMRLSR